MSSKWSERLDTKSVRYQDKFRSELQASCVSSNTEKGHGYSKNSLPVDDNIYIYIYISFLWIISTIYNLSVVSIYLCK